METRVLNGATYKDQIFGRIKEEIATLTNGSEERPGITFIAMTGHEPLTKYTIALHEQAARNLGFSVTTEILSCDAHEEKLFELIDRLKQVTLFQIIKEELPSNVSFVHEISELLGISYDSTYRRIRGEKELALEELKILCQKYHISLNTLFRVESQNIIFNSLAIGELGCSFIQWLNTILNEIKDIHACRQKEIFYSAKDIPIFHYFEFPELFAFKVYFWNKVFFSAPGFEEEFFRFDMADKVMEVGKLILSTYNKIPTVELWNEETFNSLLRQIEFCHVCGYFAGKEDSLKILEKVETMISHLQDQARTGFRFMYGTVPEGIDGNYKLYCNEVLLGDNTIFILKDGQAKTFLTYNVINLLVTENSLLCNQVETSLRNLTKKSTLISSTSEKERHRFFNTLFQKIEDLRARIQV